jgi:two-component system, NarL family, sensor kinase
MIENLNVIITAVIVVALIIGFFIFAVVRQRRRIWQWQRARIAAEINTLESERKRIAGDLHDELGPMLSAIKLQINHLEPVNAAEAAILQKSSNQIDDIITRFREISYNLLPNTLVRKGFVKATHEFIGKTKNLHALQIEFSSPDFSMAPQREVNLYRIVQEIIHNTIKHAQATKLIIQITQKGKNILLQTKDNGIGFNFSVKKGQGKGMGLLSLQSRAELLGGQLLVHTKPGEGTIFEIEIPLTT